MAGVRRIIDVYLDAGGNFIETAPSYGSGSSETKIGLALEGRRDTVFLSTKCHLRTAAETEKSIDESLRRLRTDRVDNLFIHDIATPEDLEAVSAPDGAVAAAERAREAGKVLNISFTSHSPTVMAAALERFEWDAVMLWLNYLDRFNFPSISREIIPEARRRRMGVIAMKPLADGYLFRSAPSALRWVWSQRGVTAAACGANTVEMLMSDIEAARSFTAMTTPELEELYRSAPELGTYVCRQCGKCRENAAGVDIPEIFRLEGWVDRQMASLDLPESAADYALRERLKGWFGTAKAARAEFEERGLLKGELPDVHDVETVCPYNIPIGGKLRNALYKLTGDGRFF